MPQVNLTFRIPAEWKSDLERLAEKSGRSVSELGQDAIAAYLKKPQADTLATVMTDVQLRLTQLEQRHQGLAAAVAMQQGTTNLQM